MKTKCLDCGEEFEDEYSKVNNVNIRIYCDKCVDRRYNEQKR
jgi:hypothetical protein